MDKRKWQKEIGKRKLGKGNKEKEMGERKWEEGKGGKEMGERKCVNRNVSRLRQLLNVPAMHLPVYFKWKREDI